jgi:ATP-dependent RNA helicase RhlE
MNTFAEFGLLPSLLKTLKIQKIFKPTEIQTFAIPLLMSGQSVVGVSQTGSGKTLTYVLPVLHLLKELETAGNAVTENSTPRALVLVPTRDLGEQVSKVFKSFTHDTRLRVRPALGGMEMDHVRRNIAGPFEVLLATPGRLIQLLEKRLLDLSDVKILIIDEADQMLDKGFLQDSKVIVDACPQDIPLALFSATVSKSVEELMSSLFAKAEVIRSQGAGKIVETLKTVNETVIDGLRWPIFEKILKTKVSGGTIVFANTREQCDRIAKEMTEKGYSCLLYRGEMERNERRTNLKKFRAGEVDVLISTDLASRGLDLEHVGRVVNYHLPQQMENYLHRVGRTARAGRTGLVINLVTERDLPLIAALEGKGQTPKTLKARFKDKNGRRLHLAKELRKPRHAKSH